jgi:hypothetical protein
MEEAVVNPTQPAPASTAWLAEAAVVHVAKAAAAVVMAVALVVAVEAAVVVVVTAVAVVVAAVPLAADQFTNR